LSWLEADAAAIEVAWPLAKGCYQRALLRGDESLSGSTLRGKASRYSGRYRQSARNLLARVEATGLVRVSERRGPHNRRVLVLESIGLEPVAMLAVATRETPEVQS
jgi:hypothetical protein